MKPKIEYQLISYEYKELRIEYLDQWMSKKYRYREFEDLTDYEEWLERDMILRMIEKYERRFDNEKI